MTCAIHRRAFSGLSGIPRASSAVLFISASLSLFLLGTNSTHHNLACPPLFECLINIPPACPISSQPTSLRRRLPGLRFHYSGGARGLLLRIFRKRASKN